MRSVSHLGSRAARLLPGVLGALIVAPVFSPPDTVTVPGLTVLTDLTDLIEGGDSSVLIEVMVRRNILGELMRPVRKPEKEGEEFSSWPWLSLPCRLFCLDGTD